MGIYRSTNPLEFDDVDGIVINESAPSPNIQGQPANIAILAGQFQRGPKDELVQVGSIADFHEKYGKSSYAGNLELKNKKFGVLKVIRVVATGAAKATLTVNDITPDPALVIESLYEGAYGNNITVLIEAGSTSGKKYTFTDTNPNAVLNVEVYDNITVAGKSDVELNEIFGNSRLVLVKTSGTLEPEDLAATSLATGSDGTLVDTDYESAIAAAEQERAGNVLWTDKYSATIKGYLKLHVLSAPDKMVIVGADSESVDLAATITDADSYRDTEGRIIYAFNHIQTRINGVLVYTNPASWIASIISNTSPHIDPAYADNIQYMAGAVDMKFKLSRDNYKSAMAAGICAMEYDRDLGGHKPKSGVVTQIINSSKVTILRRRMADFYSDSVSVFLKNYQNAPNTLSNRTEVKGAITSFDTTLINDGILPGDNEVQGGGARLIDTEVLNTDLTIGQGFFKILVKRRIYSAMRFIVFQIEIGETVVVTEGE